MKRSVFYSFHYEPDNWRTSQIRNIGLVEGNKVANDNDWEKVKRSGYTAIKNWIDDQIKGCSCTIVLIGENTANRPWINYEIAKSWYDGKGIFGIYIHNLKDSSGHTANKGENPFDYVKSEDGTKLSKYVKAYNPPYSDDSRLVYLYIALSLRSWIEEAINDRKQQQ